MVYPVSSRLPADCATQVDGASRLQSPRSSWSARLDLSCVPHPMVIDKKQTCIEEWTEGKSTITQTQQSHKRIHGFWQLRTSSIQHASPKSEKKRKNPCKRGKLTSLNPIFERSHNKNKQKKKRMVRPWPLPVAETTIKLNRMAMVPVGVWFSAVSEAPRNPQDESAGYEFWLHHGGTYLDSRTDN